MIHHKKIFSRHFTDIANGIKRFEIRLDFYPEIGDTIVLHEHNDTTKEETGRMITVFVQRCYSEYYGLLPGYSMIMFEVCQVMLRDGTLKKIYTKNDM